MRLVRVMVAGMGVIVSGVMFQGSKLFQLVESFESWVDDVNGHAEGFGDGLHDFECNGIASGFDAPDVGSLQSGTQGEFFLCESGFLAERSDTITDALPDLLFHFFVHSS